MVVAAAPEGVNVQVPATDVIVWPVGSAAVEAAHEPPAEASIPPDVPPELALPPVPVGPPSEFAPPAPLRAPVPIAPDCPPEATGPPPALAPAAPPRPVPPTPAEPDCPPAPAPPAAAPPLAVAPPCPAFEPPPPLPGVEDEQDVPKIASAVNATLPKKRLCVMELSCLSGRTVGASMREGGTSDHRPNLFVRDGPRLARPSSSCRLSLFVISRGAEAHSRDSVCGESEWQTARRCQDPRTRSGGRRPMQSASAACSTPTTRSSGGCCGG